MGQKTANGTVTISTTSVEAIPNRQTRRTSFLIVNTSAAAIATIAKGDIAAVANQGIVLQPTGIYSESNGDNFTCWQGAIQIVGSGAGSCALVETYEEV